MGEASAWRHSEKVVKAGVELKMEKNDLFASGFFL